MLKYILLLTIISTSLFAQEVKPDTLVTPVDSVKIKTDTITLAALDTLKAEAGYDTLSYAEEYKRDYWKTFFGGRIGFGQNSFKIDENSVDRQGLNGLPILDAKGEIVKNSFVNNKSFGTGFTGALFFRFTRGSFYVQPELAYTLRAGKFDILNKDLSLYKRVNGAFASIDVPILLGIRTRKTRVFFGPSTNFAFKMNKNLKNALSEFVVPETLNGKFFSRPVFNFQVGIGYELKGYFIDIRYDKGLKPYTGKDIGPNSSPQSFNLQSDGISISIGILGH